jgi:hypothetical protein
MMAKTSVYDEIVINYDLNFLLTFLQTYEGEAWHVSFLPFFFDLILLTTLLIILPMALIGLFKDYYSEKTRWRGVWLTFVFSVFIATVLSKPLWDRLPLLFEVQFPWRWLNIVSVCAPILAAGGLMICFERYWKESSRIAILAVFGLLSICATASLSWSISSGTYIPPARSEAHAERVIREEGFRFWWTIWTRDGFELKAEERVAAENRAVAVTNWQALNRSFSVEAGAPQNIRVAVFYHPNWHAAVNNQSVAVSPDATGAAVFPVPAESSEVTLNFVETNKVRGARRASWAALFILVVLFFATFRRKNLNGS